MGADTLSSLGNFVWGIADQLRGVYKPHQYGNVILPMTTLRRLDCILEPTREDVRALAQKFDNPGALMVRVERSTGLGFYNTSEFTAKQFAESPDPRDSVLAAIADNQGAHNKRADYFYGEGAQVGHLMRDIAWMVHEFAAEPPSEPASRDTDVTAH